MKKKLLAMLLIVCMMCGSSLTAFAGYDVSENSTGSGTVSGSGDVSYVNPEVYKVKLPTNLAMDLIVDPQGLTGLQEGTDVSGADLAANAGLITTAAPIYAANLSSVPMKISVAMSVSGNATVVNDEASVSANTANNILLYAVPSKVDTKGSTDSGYVPSTTGIVITGTPVTADFILDAADYVFHREGDVVTYVLKEDGERHGTALNFEGKVNTKADWSDFVKAENPSTITWQAVFNFQKAGTSETAAAASPYGMMTYGGDKVTLPEIQNVAPTFEAGSVAGTIEYTAGSGDDAVASITKVEMNNGGTWYDGFNADTQFGGLWGDGTDENGVITLQSGYLDCFAVTSGDAKVTYENAAGRTVTVTVTNVKIK